MKPSQILRDIRARLPHGTQRVVKTLGWEIALYFLSQHSDSETYVPLRYSASNKLFKGLTEAQANAIIAEFGGENMKWPTHRKMLSSERYHSIIQSHRKGLSITKNAAKHKCSKPEVVRVVQHFGIKNH